MSEDAIVINNDNSEDDAQRNEVAAFSEALQHRGTPRYAPLSKNSSSPSPSPDKAARHIKIPPRDDNHDQSHQRSLRRPSMSTSTSAQEANKENAARDVCSNMAVLPPNPTVEAHDLRCMRRSIRQVDRNLGCNPRDVATTPLRLDAVATNAAIRAMAEDPWPLATAADAAGEEPPPHSVVRPKKVDNYRPRKKLTARMSTSSPNSTAVQAAAIANEQEGTAPSPQQQHQQLDFAIGTCEHGAAGSSIRQPTSTPKAQRKTTTPPKAKLPKIAAGAASKISSAFDKLKNAPEPRSPPNLTRETTLRRELINRSSTPRGPPTKTTEPEQQRPPTTQTCQRKRPRRPLQMQLAERGPKTQSTTSC